MDQKKNHPCGEEEREQELQGNHPRRLSLNAAQSNRMKGIFSLPVEQPLTLSSLFQRKREKSALREKRQAEIHSLFNAEPARVLRHPKPVVVVWPDA